MCADVEFSRLIKYIFNALFVPLGIDKLNLKSWNVKKLFEVYLKVVSSNLALRELLSFF